MSSIVAPATVFSLTYVSSASSLFTVAELVELLQICRRNNLASGVTGMLLYKDGNFMQALEGDETTVRRVHAKIVRDPRHAGLITLLEGNVPQRQFGEWSMGFHHLSDPLLAGTPGFNAFLNTSLADSDFTRNPSRVRRLLATFRKTM